MLITNNLEMQEEIKFLENLKLKIYDNKFESIASTDKDKDKLKNLVYKQLCSLSITLKNKLLFSKLRTILSIQNFEYYCQYVQFSANVFLKRTNSLLKFLEFFCNSVHKNTISLLSHEYFKSKT
jgi:hypothetical protein